MRFKGRRQQLHARVRGPLCACRDPVGCLRPRGGEIDGEADIRRLMAQVAPLRALANTDSPPAVDSDGNITMVKSMRGRGGCQRQLEPFPPKEKTCLTALPVTLMDLSGL
eukprot:scaffold24381_cov21-Prasinocladus_malaysianus.AAC.2